MIQNKGDKSSTDIVLVNTSIKCTNKNIYTDLYKMTKLVTYNVQTKVPFDSTNNTFWDCPNCNAKLNISVKTIGKRSLKSVFLGFSMLSAVIILILVLLGLVENPVSFIEGWIFFVISFLGGYFIYNIFISSHKGNVKAHVTINQIFNSDLSFHDIKGIKSKRQSR